MKICIVGQGYIGLPTAALFAKKGCEVLGVDVNEKIVEKLNQGIAHIEEPGISDAIKNAVEEGHYRASLKPEEADTFIITVPTPYVKEDLSCDLSYVISACTSILPVLKKGNVVIIESTIAPMSTDEIIKPIFEKEGFVIGEDLFLAHCPERVLPGQIMNELVNNNRIVGGITEECSRRDVNIALANELAKIGAEIGVNALDVIEMANKHPRVNIHSPGPGVGGHCLAIDPYFIYAKAPETAKIIKLARDTNNSMPGFVIENTGKILSNLDKEAEKISVLGVAYKGNTDDARESPAFEIINGLKAAGYEIAIHDPHFDNPDYFDLDEATKDSSLVLILTDHNEFKDLDYELLSKNMKAKIIFDTKNIIKDVPEDITLINYGNLYKYNK